MAVQQMMIELLAKLAVVVASLWLASLVARHL
jgi:hypothetical protein